MNAVLRNSHLDELYVLYDQECELCRRCRAWFGKQETDFPLNFIPLQSPDIEKLFPGVSRFKPSEEILAISNEGAVYAGGRAWLMCLWATLDYREWAERLAHPALLPLVRKVCSLVSANRLSLSALLANPSPIAIASHLNSVDADESCGPASCTSTVSKASSRPFDSWPVDCGKIFQEPS